MKKVYKKLTFTFLVVIRCFVAQSQVNDNFNDGDFTVSPVWTPSSPTDFRDTLGMIRSNVSTASASFYISTPNSTATNCQWEFFANLKFATSSANYVDVYLTCDNSNLSAAGINGYFVRLGNTLDEICLYKNVAGTATKIIDGVDGIITSSSNNLIKIKVIRDATNQFTLSRDMTGTGSSYTTEGSIIDATFTTSSYFGFFIRQSTSSFFKKHYFDDVYVGPIILDTTPPDLLLATPINSTALDVLFDEPLDPTSSQITANYSVNNGIGTSATAILDAVNPALVHLTFGTPFVNLTAYKVYASSVADVSSNPVILDSASFTYFIADTAAWREAVVNEFLADPTPQIALPSGEFIEIYNRSSKYFDVGGWTLTDGSSTATLSSRILAPGDYLIICANADTIEYKLFGFTMGVSSFPSLNNSGDTIRISNQFGTILDEIIYDLTWYQDAAKADGGWSVEQINPDAICINKTNWAASNDGNGGSPGSMNSIYSNLPDTIPPKISSITVTSNLQVTVYFTEPLKPSTIGTVSFALTGGPSVLFSTINTFDYLSADITFSLPLDSGITYTLMANNLTDCEGNGLGTSDDGSFILPFKPRVGDLIINEILFNPSSGVSDFVEIYNNSSRSINLKNWEFANIGADTIANNKIISTTDLLINPGEYYAFTVNRTALINYYTQAASLRVLSIPSMPSLDNDSSTIILIMPANIVSDRFSYIEATMQFPLLQSTEGVSLERINFNRPTQDAGNWHSAAEAVGFATPGYQNSQLDTGSTNGAVLTLERDIFSPDNDGYQDIINFSYEMPEAGYLASATIYDSKGREIKKLLQNELLGAKGTFTWDGINSRNEKSLVGIHVLYFEYFNLSGTVKKVKKSFVLATKF